MSCQKMEESTNTEWPSPPAGTGQTNVLVTAGGERLDFTENFQARLSVLLRYVFLTSLGSALYAATIAVDVCVALQDIQTGHRNYAIINLALVATPSVLFGSYMFYTCFMRYNGPQAFCNAILWLLAIPLIPLFPIMRTITRIRHALAASCNTHNQANHMSLLSNPSSAHLLKFLQALVSSAPQLVLRLHKMLAMNNGDKFFDSVGLMTSTEWVQMVLSLVAAALTVSLGVGRTPNTRGLFDGSLALENATGGSVVLAFVWWFFFLAARIPCLSLLIYSFESWSIVFLILHCPLVLALQTNNRCQPAVRLFFGYIFSAFLFIFVYIEVNLTRRINSVWIPHVMFTALAFLEQSAILVPWFLVEKGILPIVSLIPPNVSYKNDTLISNSTYSVVMGRDEAILCVHYILLSFSAICMALTFCCRSKS